MTVDFSIHSLLQDAGGAHSRRKIVLIGLIAEDISARSVNGRRSQMQDSSRLKHIARMSISHIYFVYRPGYLNSCPHECFY